MSRQPTVVDTFGRTSKFLDASYRHLNNRIKATCCHNIKKRIKKLIDKW